MRYWEICLALICFTVPSVQGKTLKPADFAYGLSLNLEGKGALYSLAVPDDVYSHITRDDFGDIRIFNGSDEMVPHAVLPPVWEKKSRKPSVTLPFFPLFSKQKTPDDGLAMQVKTNDQGTIIEVQTGAQEDTGQAIDAYLFDLSSLDQSPSDLFFYWTSPEKGLLVKSISLAGSADLLNWQPIISRATLAELNFRGHKLYKNNIALQGNIPRYIRMTWPEDNGRFALTRVEARFPREKQKPPHKWITTGGKKVRNENRIAYIFNTAAKFPVDRLNIKLPENNSLMQAVLKSRRTLHKSWTTRARGLFYNLGINGTTLKNGPVSISPTMDPCWLLELISDSSGLGKQSPKLQLGWSPHRLVFLARGEGPFQLAYGSAGVLPPKHSMENLLGKIEQKHHSPLIKSASPGEKRILGGNAALRMSPPFPWKQCILWGVLLLGVFIIALMAARLYRQMIS